MTTAEGGHWSPGYGTWAMPGTASPRVSSSTVTPAQRAPSQCSHASAGPSSSPTISATSKNRPSSSAGSAPSRPTYMAGVASSTGRKGGNAVPRHAASAEWSSHAKSLWLRVCSGAEGLDSQ